ncbi:MAG: hypothetical protein WC346_18595 [Methanogenium sp.]|jgi:hypothetical protein
MNNKLVNIDHLDKFRIMLKTCKNRRELLSYFDKYIAEVEKQDINQLKRIIYSLMMNYKDVDKDKYTQYYILYQNIKNGMEYNTVLEIYKDLIEN